MSLPHHDADRDLFAQTRPADWADPEPSGRYNLVVIGAGTAGLVCAAAAAGLGARVALVEKHALGGDCLHAGCVPSKALLRCARAAADARRAGEFGVRTGNVAVDFAAVMGRMRRLRAGLAHADSAGRFRGLGVDVFFGPARFAGPDSVAVGGRTLSFARAVIATGSRPADPGVPGLTRDDYLTNETVFDLAELPRTLLVLGAGPIGCELGQAFARFGSEVHLVNRSAAVLGREEPEARDLVRAALERDGVRLRLGARVAAGRREGGRVSLTLEGGERLEGDALLVAVGRRPGLDELDLPAAGVESDRDGVRVNDFLQTTNPRIYAAGDVCSSFKFTHAADAMARLVVRNALFFGRGRVSRLVIPHCTYTEPEVASVGLSAAEAAARGVAVQTFRTELAEVDRAVLEGESEGFASVHVRRGTDRIVGATAAGAFAGEWVNEVVLAMTRGLGLGRLANVVRPYPTRAEALKRLADAYQRSRLTPFRANLLRRLLSWRR